MSCYGVSHADEANKDNGTIREKHSHHGSGMLKELATYLKLDPKTMNDKLQTESLADIAKEQGIDRTELKAKVIEMMKARVADKPAPLGKTMDFSAAADKLIDNKGGWHHSPKRRHGRLVHADELAAILKVTPDQLKEYLHSGKTLANIANENGVSVKSVIDQQVKAITDHLDHRLAEGKLSQEQYAERKAKVKEFVTDFVYGRNSKTKKETTSSSQQ
ncbi:hypothetical protein [Paenibacillus sp. GCM10028914]|uniref:hypothetical protein n=1 Tax=Paenibacillus sp. GCM10028914 TaxID=3273416 RepID=UPI00360D0188